MRKKVSVRLPESVKPYRYNITIKPDLESCTFQGSETIKIKLSEDTQTIILHAAELDITSASCITGHKQNWPAQIKYNEKQETAVLQFANRLPKGNHKLKLSFQGLLGEKMRGFYRSSYEHGDRKKYLAVTQFEATDARRAFPCFDEPRHKAVFEVTLIVPGSHTVVSNTLPAVVAEHEGGFKAVTFLPTPKMSTYLLAFITGEMEMLETKTKSKVLVRVFTTPGKKQQGKFALECAKRMLEFYEWYFDIRYPLPALDMIAVPDFMAGAMENWGAVTFRETAILVDEEHSSLSSRQWVALVVAHEIAHQWFGNLVTMDWWTHLWLNEGFASYMEYLAVDKLFSKWQIWQQFMAADFVPAMSKDSLKATHPIEIEVHHPREIDEIFDAISYSKGASVIRMLANFLGEKNFRAGLRHYLTRHIYANATTADLWKALEQVSKQPVARIMNAWTTRPGLPMVRLNPHSKDTHRSKISQEQFTISQRPARASKTPPWPIPLSYIDTGGRVRKLLMIGKNATLPTAALKLNASESGFYRHLDRARPQGWGAAEFSRLPALDRWGLVNNAWATAQAGLSATTAALQLSLLCRDDSEMTVFEEAAKWVLSFGHLYFGSNLYPVYEAFQRHFFATQAKRLGWQPRKGENHREALARPFVLYAFGLSGDETTQLTAQRYFLKMVKHGPRSVPADLRAPVYRLTALTAGQPEFRYLKRLYLETDLQEEKQRLAAGLCSFTSEKLLAEALAFGFSSAVRPAHSWQFCQFVGQQPTGITVLWKFIKSNWPEILARYGQGGLLLTRVIESLLGVSDTRILKDMEKFFHSQPTPGAARTVEQVLEKVAAQIDWKKREQKNVEQFLKTFSSKL